MVPSFRVQTTFKLTRSNKPDILFLMETKASNSRMTKWLHSTYFGFSDFVPPCGNSGGLYTTWTKFLSLFVVAKNVNFF